MKALVAAMTTTIAKTITITSEVPAMDLANTIFGSGVTVTGASFEGDPQAAGVYSGALEGIAPGDGGVILSTGRAGGFQNATGGNNQHDGFGADNGGINGNADMNALAGAPTYDGAFLNATFIPDGDMITMNFVFSSEEYPEYVNSSYNDVFAVWVNGDLIPVTLVKNGQVTINNVNGGFNENLYVDNTGGGFETEMDGFTLVLSLKAPVVKGAENTIRIGIADAGDAAYDSNLLIMADSIQPYVLAHDDEINASTDSIRVYDLLGNDGAAQGETLMITQINGQDIAVGGTITLPTGQQVTLNGDGTITVATGSAAGSDTFTYTVTDSAGISDIGLVTLKTSTDPDGIVTGTAGDDLIDLNYTGDPDGDRVDHNDALGVEGTSGDGDVVMAGDGNDTVFAGQGDDIVYGGAGDDLLYGGTGNDRLEGGPGNDTLFGGLGDDTLLGGDGDDEIYGDGNSDHETVIWANDSDKGLVRIDIANGQATQTFIGNTGMALGDIAMAPDGRLYGVGEGNNTIYEIDKTTAALTPVGDLPPGFGSSGASMTFDEDGVAYVGGAGGTIWKFDPQNPAGATEWWTDTGTGHSASDLVFSGDKAYVIVTGPTGQVLTELTLDENGGVIGQHNIGELPGTLYNGLTVDSDGMLYISGPDAFYSFDPAGGPVGGGPLTLTRVDDTEQPGGIYLGATSDAKTLSDNDLIEGGDGNDRLYGGGGRDTIFGGEGDDLLDGGKGDDVLYGGSGNDVLYGGSGNDLLYGGDGDDLLVGGSGSDTVYGGTGDDTFIVDGGGDSLYGGDDRDTFVLTGPDAAGTYIDGGDGGVNEDTLDFTQWTGGGWRIKYDDDDITNGFVEFLDGDKNVTGTLRFENIEKVVPCFTPGTLITTNRGAVPVEDLVEGDMILTLDDGYQPLRWIGRRDLATEDLAAAPHLQPIRIARGALGQDLPERDMLVSPQHRMLWSSIDAEFHFGESEVLVPAIHLIGLPGVTRADCREASYIHLLFDQHQLVRGDGAWSESFQPGQATLAGMHSAQRREILELFPELGDGRAYPAARSSLKRHETRLLLRRALPGAPTIAA